MADFAQTVGATRGSALYRDDAGMLRQGLEELFRFRLESGESAGSVQQIRFDGTACHVKKSIPVLRALNQKLGLSGKKHTTDDMMFTVETVSCLGACGLAPAMMVNEDVYPRMTPEAAEELIDKIRGGAAL